MQIAQWIKDLDAAGFAKREKADRELRRNFRVAQHDLQQALKDTPSAEQRTRIEAILGSASTSGVELQMIRVIDVLAAMDSPDARAVLRAMAEGGYGQVFASG